MDVSSLDGLSTARLLGTLVASGAIGGLGFALAQTLDPVGRIAAAATGTDADTPAPAPRSQWGARVCVGGLAALLLPILPVSDPASVVELVAYGIVAGYGGPSLLAATWARMEGVTTRAELDTTRAAVAAADTELADVAGTVEEALSALPAPGQPMLEGVAPATPSPTRATLTAALERLAAARVTLAAAAPRRRR